MMPLPLYDRFMATGHRLQRAIRRGEPTEAIVAEQDAILDQWKVGNCEEAGYRATEEALDADLYQTVFDRQPWQNGEIIYDPDRGYHIVRQQRDIDGRWRKPTRWERFLARIKVWYRRVVGMEWME